MLNKPLHALLLAHGPQGVSLFIWMFQTSPYSRSVWVALAHLCAAPVSPLFTGMFSTMYKNSYNDELLLRFYSITLSVTCVFVLIPEHKKAMMR